MGEIKVGDKVMLRGTVMITSNHGPKVLVQAATPGTRRVWIHKNSLTDDVFSPSPVTLKCNWGCEHRLTDLETLQDRCAALGMLNWGSVSLDEFLRLCAELREKGVTAEQFVEGL